MDRSRLQRRPAVSVGTFPQPPPALCEQYLRASFFNETYNRQQYLHDYRPRPPLILLSQHLRPQQQRIYPHAAQHPLATMNPALDNDHQPFAPGYSTEDAKAMLTGDFDENMFGFGPPSIVPAVYRQQPAFDQQYSFRPLEPLQAVVAPPTAAFKVDNEHATGIMPLQTTRVDTRQYSPVSIDEVWNTPFNTSSPSTINTDEDSPMTPALDHHDSFFHHYTAKHGHPDTRLYASGAHVARGQAVPQTDFGSFSSNSSYSYPGSSFGAPTFSHGHDSSEQLHGLDINYPSAREGVLTSTVTNPTFDSLAVHPEFESLGGLDTDDDATSAASSPSSTDIGVRNDRDRYLLDMRTQGYSYKEIKRQGKFKEAESTLRGRMRVLTKEKHERVRRPVWHGSDVDLLRRAVSKCTGDSVGGSRKKPNAKTPWLKISRWMNNNGSSYPFAPATCAKKWAEIGRK